MACPDCHSRTVPKQHQKNTFVVSYMSNLPISSIIATHTRTDLVLSVVYEKVLNGWNNPQDDTGLFPFFKRRAELTVHDGCVKWGMRVVIPGKLQKAILDELHSGHLGIVKMKRVARSYV